MYLLSICSMMGSMQKMGTFLGICLFYETEQNSYTVFTGRSDPMICSRWGWTNWGCQDFMVLWVSQLWQQVWQTRWGLFSGQVQGYYQSMLPGRCCCCARCCCACCRYSLACDIFQHCTQNTMGLISHTSLISSSSFSSLSLCWTLSLPFFSRKPSKPCLIQPPPATPFLFIEQLVHSTPRLPLPPQQYRSCSRKGMQPIIECSFSFTNRTGWSVGLRNVCRGSESACRGSRQQKSYSSFGVLWANASSLVVLKRKMEYRDLGAILIWGSPMAKLVLVLRFQRRNSTSPSPRSSQTMATSSPVIMTKSNRFSTSSEASSSPVLLQ